MNYVALICARAGSKSVPGKNIRLLGHRPLIGWAIQLANKVGRVSRTIVSTDSEEIARIAKEQGAEVPFLRPEELARDSSPEWLVWRHALDYLSDSEQLQVNGLVVVPPTAPLRNIQDIDNCLDEYEKGDVDVVITVSEARRSPYFNMVTSDVHGFCSLVIPPSGRVARRQEAPAVFDMTTVAYVARPRFVQEQNGMFDGRVRGVNVPAERALDIDSLLDFRIAECLLGGSGEQFQ